MAVGDEIDALATRARMDHDDLFNFGASIHLVWKHFEGSVRRGTTLKARILKTGTEVTEQDLINRYPRYRTTYLHGIRARSASE